MATGREVFVKSPTLRDLSIRFSHLVYSKRNKIEMALFPEEVEKFVSLNPWDRHDLMMRLVIDSGRRDEFHTLINQYEQDGQ